MKKDISDGGNSLNRFGSNIKTVDGESIGVLKPNASWKIEDWNPVSDDGTRSTADQKQELIRHLPSEWEISYWEPWDPKKAGHTGNIVYQVHIEHDDGTMIKLRPEDSGPGSKRECMKVYNSHKLKKQFPDNSRKKLLRAEVMNKLSSPESIFNALVIAAEEHTARPSLSAFGDES